MSYTKSDNARVASGSDSEDDIPTPPPKGKGRKSEPKGKKVVEKKSYRCDRCNFSSSSKAKYTKHAKSAHSGTIVQCDHCEFKTPYKWNLDRHYKNHLGGGVLCCHLCNFSCDIKQSLTVHLQNHHSNVPEEIIESVKRQQIPPRNQSINNPLLNKLNNGNNSSNGSPTTTATTTNSTSNINNNNTDSNSSTGAPSTASDSEKKVPPLRISRSLTGLSLGEENNSSSSSSGGGGGCGKKEDESTATVAQFPAAVAVAGVAIAAGNLSDSDDKRNTKKCDLCDFETSGEGSGNSVMKKHLASQHGIHHKSGKHHHHHKKGRTPSPSSPSAEYSASSPSPPSLPVVPIPLPPKKSNKGSTSPRPGQSATSSTTNSPAIHRSQSPLKASEAITAYGSSDHNSLQQAVAPSSDEERTHGQSSILSHHGEESAFTPVLGSEFHSLNSLKKPKHRALAQFYQKIKPKFTPDTESQTTEEIPATTATLVEPVKVEEEDGQKSGSVCSSKSNRCQYCRQRCKSTADLALHLEKCADAVGQVTKKEIVETGESCDQGKKKGNESEETASKVQISNGSTTATETNDDLIGFETAPGVGAIHTGKMDEMEYLGYAKGENGNPEEEETDHNENRAINEAEEDDEEMEEVSVGSVGAGSKGTGKGGKAITSRKVYRCPENDCSFWATTASRFHVHIVGHYNLKPFECSECHYKSNWRWDVNKHIRLKTPKDPKHASAKTLLTHESGQRDYRKYDNYLVCMSLTHSANAKAPDCSTVANKRTKGGNTVASPKSSPEIPPTSASAAKEASATNLAVANSPPSTTSSTAAVLPAAKQRSPKYAKALAAASPAPPSSIIATPYEPPAHEEITAFEYHPSQSNSSSHHQQAEDTHASYPVSAASPANSSGEGRSFVETRMLAGGEMYQQQNSLLKQDVDMKSPSANDGDREKGGDDVPPNGFDLTLKRPHSRHAHHQQNQEEMRSSEDVIMMASDMQAKQQQNAMMPAAPNPVTPPTKKSRLKQIQQQQEQQQKQLEQQTAAYETSGATTEGGNKTLSLWQCIKCSFKHPNKELVSNHIRDMHKPKKGDTVSLLAHNHLVQVMIPEQDVEALMTYSTNNQEVTDYTARALGITTAQKKEIYQQMFHENGKVLSCKYCPFSTGLLYEMEIHADHHLNKSNSYYSCPHCSYSVAVKSELQEHLKLHGGTLPEIQNRVINSSTTHSPTPERLPMLSPTSTTEHLSIPNHKKDGNKNRYHCLECPYAINDPSEFQYHRQCHEPHDYPFKCHRCSFNVSVKFHLLQHLRVHGIQIDEIGIPQQQPSEHYPPEPVYEDVSNDYSPEPQAIQDEPLNLSIFANRKPVVVWENGVPMEGYKCSVCPQIFHDLNDLKEHEYVNNHRSTNNTSTGNATNYNSTASSRQCDSPPCEAMNLSFKPVEHSSKKSSQSHSKVNNNSGKRSVASASATILQQQQLQQPIPMSSPSPSSVHSAETGGSSSTKGEKEYLYLCDGCPARFFFEKELKIHHTFHENKSPFQCPKCSYSARQKDPHLMSHMRVHGAAYQEKTKALLVKFPRAKVNLPPSANAAASAAAAAAAAALSAASLINSSILNPNFNFQTAAAAMLSATTGGKFKPGDVSTAFSYPGEQLGLDGLRKNGLSIICPKCPEKFYNTQTFQLHFEMHNSNGRADYRCRFCDYCAESRKSLAIHEIVHTGSDLNIEPAALAGKLLTSAGTAFNPVSMMAMVAHQDSPFVATAAPPTINIAGNAAASGTEVENIDKNAIPVPDEAYEGNPEFTYPTYMKNGRVKSKRYKCIKCPSAFEKKDQYHTHIGLHGSNQKYKCTVCDYAVTYYANYIQHLKKHENQNNTPTDLLSLGKKRHHQGDDALNGSLAKIPKLAENGENSSSSSLDTLESPPHTASPINTLLKCSFCPFQCYDDPTLESHLVHHQTNPNWLHVCNICTFRTSSKKSLKEHARLHLLSSFTLQHQQQQQQQNGITNNGHHHHHQQAENHRNGEYVNGYDENNHHHRRQQHEKHNNHRNQYAEHEDSSNGSM